MWFTAFTNFIKVDKFAVTIERPKTVFQLQGTVPLNPPPLAKAYSCNDAERAKQLTSSAIPLTEQGDLSLFATLSLTLTLCSDDRITKSAITHPLAMAGRLDPTMLAVNNEQ